jgi:hypothetical protein
MAGTQSRGMTQLLDSSSNQLRVRAKRTSQFAASPVQAVAVPLAIYAASRAIGAAFLVLGASRQAELAYQQRPGLRVTVPESPGYWGVMANWDGQWYKSIALDGYPSDLPTAAGTVLQNEWAFYPLFPYLCRAVMELTGATFEVVGGLLSLICGGVAIVLLHRLLRRRMSAFAAGATVAALCSFPAAPVLQVAYSESVTLLVLVLALWALQSSRYGPFCLLVVCLSLTRPIALPLTFVVLLHWFARWKCAGLPRSPREWAKPTATIALTGVSAFVWPVIAWVSTGERRAFLETQEAWRFNGGQSFLAAGVLGQAVTSSWPAFFLAVAPLAGFFFLAVRSPARRWGLEIRAWIVFYPAYIMLATQPTYSVLRYLLLALVVWWPVPEAGEESDERAVGALLQWSLLALLVSAGIVAQYHWVTQIFTIDVSPAHQSFP